MASFHPKFRQYAFTFVTTVCLLAILAYYLLVHLPSKENYIEERAFRVLEQKQEHLAKKVKNVRRIVKNIVTAAREKKDTSIINELNTLNQHQIVFNINKLDTSLQPDSSAPKTKTIKGLSSMADVIDDPIVEQLILKRGKWMVEDSLSTTFNMEASSKKSQDSVQFNINYYYPVSQLVSSVLSEHVFDHFLIIKGDITPVYQTINASLVFTEENTPFKKTKGLYSSHVKNITVVGNDYHLFIYPISQGPLAGMQLCGLILDKRYHAETRSISTITIILLSLGLILLALGWPFFKLMLMNANERLNALDAVFAAFSTIVGSSILIIMLWSCYDYFIADKNLIDQQLASLAKNIDTSLTTEIQHIYSQLEYYDTPDTSIKEEQVYKNPDTITKLSYPYYKNVSWIDSSGLQILKFTARSTYIPNLNVSERRYFSDIKQGLEWKWVRQKNSLDLSKTLNQTDSILFVLEPIYSWSTGENMAAVSKASSKENTTVVALTTKLYSVIDPLLPKNFGYCILNEQGIVWFHSDKNKNLQEHFFKECINHHRLHTSVSNHYSDFLNVEYHGKDYRVFTHPIKGIPLSIITFHDNTTLKLTHAGILYYTFLFTFISFFVVILLLILQKATSKANKLLLTTKFAYSWLIPRKSNAISYIKLSFLLVFFILAVTYLSDLEKPLFSFFLILLTNLYLYATAYFFLYEPTRQKLQEDINSIFWTILLLILIIGNVGISQIVEFNNYVQLIVFQISILSFIIILDYISIPLNFIRKLFRENNLPLAQFSLPYDKGYIMFLFLGIIVISILPSIIFYKISYRQETELWVKFSMLQLAKDFKSRKINIHQEYSNKEYFKHFSEEVNNLIASKGVYTQFFYNLTLQTPSASSLNTSNILSDKQLVYYEWIMKTRPEYTQLIRESNYLMYPVASDSSWYWQTNKKGDYTGLVYQDYKNLKEDNSPVQVYLPKQLSEPHHLFSSKANFFSVFPDINLNEENRQATGYAQTLFYILLSLLLYFFYLIIHFCVKNIFNIHLFGKKEFAKENVEMLEKHLFKNQVFLVGLPLSGKSNYLKQHRMHAYHMFNMAKKSDLQRITQLKWHTFEDEATLKLKEKRDAYFTTIDYSTHLPSAKQPVLPENNGKDNVITHQDNGTTSNTNALKAQASNEENHSFENDKSFDIEEIEFFAFDHFECLLQYEQYWQSTLTCLEELLQKNKKVLILSSKHPLQLYDCFESALATNATEIERIIHGQYCARWKYIFSHFYKIYFPLQVKLNSNHQQDFDSSFFLEKNFRHILNQSRKQKNQTTPEQCSTSTTNLADSETTYNSIKSIIDTECNRGIYLAQLNDLVTTYFSHQSSRTRYQLHEEVILKIQSMAQVYYNTLWTSLSKDEQYVIYDLAQDELVNTRKIGVINGLLNKGVLVYDGRIKLLNTSFRNYILTAIKPEEVLTMEEESRKNGNWHKFKTPLLMIVLALSGFVFITQRETYDQLIALISGFTVSVPVLIKLISIVPTGSSHSLKNMAD